MTAPADTFRKPWWGQKRPVAPQQTKRTRRKADGTPKKRAGKS